MSPFFSADRIGSKCTKAQHTLQISVFDRIRLLKVVFLCSGARSAAIPLLKVLSSEMDPAEIRLIR